MHHRIISELSACKIIRKIEKVELDGVGKTYILKIRAVLSNGWKLQIFEHRNNDFLRYSYNVFTNDKLVVRWDNAPHHKHEGEKIIESEAIDIEKLIKELVKLVNFSN